ncbi:MAG TPA: hypothetical protein VKX25_20670 [Bryobacteraceae bacterium]|jgi:hypothetical protein|nr:hypothetical protein [Bryobacteraceae bacterium]
MKRSQKKRAGSLETLVLPVVLLLTGLILIGGDRVGILSLDRIQNLWPMALIIVGLSDFLVSSDEPATTRASEVRRNAGERRA